ncbi:LysM peptidoglycan-binding domain-containing protein [Virgibacillus xinjiangensis]|uniref:LysM peptidoglycan-binding domain-containing protein n=1 Tax=Virgibacillus xinjiangensis TaxID=393090 RepID=A0ABV7CZN9_9BACI
MNYTVQPGDSLYRIARRFRTTVSHLLSINPHIQDPDVIYPGQLINLPANALSLCPFLVQGDRGPSVRRLQYLLCFVGLYTSAIDGLYGLRTQQALLMWQRSIKELDVTGVVDEETWTSLGAQCEPRPSIIPYTVRPGSSLFQISLWFGTTIEEIMRINPQITNPNRIHAGQIIYIPPSHTNG